MTPPRPFATDTAVTPAGDGRYRGEISDRWDVIGGAPNGGYLMALGARALCDATGAPDPVSVTASYLDPPEHGPVTVDVELLRGGGRHSTATARLHQDGREVVRVTATVTDLATAAGPTLMLAEPPDLPAPDELPDASELPAGFEVPRIMTRLHHRIPPERLGWAVGEPTGEGVIGGWVRWAADEPMDTLGVLLVADAYPPAVFDAGIDIGWVPTVDLSVQLRKRPAAGWLRTRFTSRHTANGYLEEDGEIWDDEGLVALSRQLALAPRG